MIAPDVKVWIATTPVDMRKSFDALAAVVENFLQRDPHGGHLFVFRNKGGHLAKILWHDREGWTIYYRRLDHGVFHFPDDGTTAVEISRQALLDLLSGKPVKTSR
jgi:transposase